MNKRIRNAVLVSCVVIVMLIFGRVLLIMAGIAVENIINDKEVVLEPLPPFANQEDEFCKLDLFAIYEKTKNDPSMFYTPDNVHSSKVSTVIAYCQGNGMMSAHLEDFQIYLGNEDGSQKTVDTHGQFDIESGEIILIIDDPQGSYTLSIPISDGEKGDYIELAFVNGEIKGVRHTFDPEFAESLLALK